MQKTIRPIALYLPQFHPIPENDAWWGKGFTEWRNVVNARPRFKGHYQPHLPADLGFYDLRLPETRQAQADLAKRYGIYGFCYYHYWFNGKRILERPFQEVFESGKPDFPFMLCWANENWTRVWDGGNNSILLKQDYSSEDDINHINALIPYFKDRRYIKINGRPVFAIYKDLLFPNMKETINVFKSECRKQGLDLYICNFERDGGTTRGDSTHQNFDSAIEFQPNSNALFEYLERTKGERVPSFLKLKRYTNFIERRIHGKKPELNFIIDFARFVEFEMNRPLPSYKIFPGVSPAWDNSSRRVDKRANIFINSSPELFKKWVISKVRRFKPYSPDENLLFVNAWNEWAEGNHLEPCQRYGHQYLEALRDGIAEATTNESRVEHVKVPIE